MNINNPDNIQNRETQQLVNKHNKLYNAKIYEFYINDPKKNKSEFRFRDNTVETTKYNIITFLPKALLFQFFRPANIYFLIIAIIQCISIISPLGPSTAIAPLAFVLSVSLIREAIEDYARYTLDSEQNSVPAEAYRNGKWVEVKSGELEMGEIVYVKGNQTFPSDMVLLDSNKKEGLCCIETATLDGETSLKEKLSTKDTAGYFRKEEGEERIETFSFLGKGTCDLPNAELYRLDGKMEITFFHAVKEERKLVPFDAQQLLLKGAKLRNTGWIIGFVVYTGHNCKIIKNSKNPKMKYSSVERLMSILLLFILIMQSALSIICAGVHTTYFNEFVKINPYLTYDDPAQMLDSLINYFTYILLLNTMIPISLIITLEIVKLIQGYFFSVDAKGFSLVREKFIKPNSVSLNEELGAVNFIFTDKTGTLTCNKMLFKYCVIGDVCYEFLRGIKQGSQKDEEQEKFRQKEDIIPFEENEMYKLAYREGIMRLNSSKYSDFNVFSSYDKNTRICLDTSSKIIEEFWKGISLCHECTIFDNNGVEDYMGMSPDDIELVRSARLQGFAFTSNGENSIKRVRFGGGKSQKDFLVLETLRFSSERKRASIIVKEDNIIKLYIKGADSIIEERLSPHTRPEIKARAKYYVEKFSSQGYRTLLVGMKILTEQEYNEWAAIYKTAQLDTVNKAESVKNANDLIEKDIFLLGATIVEDKLQHKVPQTIRDLRLAGIKIWMLTGDKMNTAYNIGLSCNLISQNLKIFWLTGVEERKNEKNEVINKTERQEVIITFSKSFAHYKGEVESGQTLPQFGIIVDEKALATINEDATMISIFLSIAKDAVAVICCRVSPIQKSQVVRMMKNYTPGKVTLAVGDGGNDVSMIMEAHIGVGICGEEGKQAVQSADYAIGEFKILRRLLFFHGRASLIRNSEMVLYFFYKNFVFTITHFYFAFYNNCSGQTIIDDWFISLYNMIFTAFPLGARACIDFDVKPEDGKIISKLMPFLYSERRDNPIFNTISFALVLFRGVVHGVINYYVLVFTLGNSHVNLNGDFADIWYFSVNCFTNMIMLVSVNLIINTRYHTWINFSIMVVLSWFTYFCFVIAVHFMGVFNSHATMAVAFYSGKFWLNFVLIVGTCGLIDFTIKSIQTLFKTSLASTLSLLVNQRGTLEDDVDLPKAVTEKLKLYKEFTETKEEKKNESNKGIELVNIRDLHKDGILQKKL